VARIGLLAVLVVVVGLYVQHALSYLSARSQANRQQAIVSALERQNAALQQQQQSLNSTATIVSAARALGMVKLGERPYAVTQPQAP
jgi:cell division protein FtsB